MKDKSVGLIKWQKAELENLPVSISIKRRIRRRAIKDYQMGEHQNPPHPFNVSPTNRCSTMTSWAADYGLKSRIPGEHMEIKSSLF